MRTTPARAPKHRPMSIADDPRWMRIVARDKSADGQFWYSVATTRVYCRPSCASRTANPKNVRIHDTLQSARATGFRPCRRCNPERPPIEAENASLVAAACRMIEENETEPSLQRLAEASGRSPGHFHRVFKAITGVTPKAYIAGDRAKRVREELASRETVTQAIYGAGFNSNGRFYAAAPGLLGMTPTQFRSGGSGNVIRFAVGECSLGAILVAATAKGVCAIQFGDDPEALVRALQDRFPKAQLLGGDEAFERLVAKVVGFVEAPAQGLDLPLDIRGTAFQQRVWKAIRDIPAGATASYRDLAKRLGAPKAVRAVAQACGANDIAVAIPCHRVVRTDGSISGYRWGVARKRALLAREKAA